MDMDIITFVMIFVFLNAMCLEKNPYLAGNVPNVKRILHQKKDINVLWTRLVGNKGAKADFF